MSDNILFRGVILKYFDLRQGKEGGDVFCRIHLSADFSDQVKEAMDWDVGTSPTNAKLPGELLASSFILTPGDPQLHDFELNFAITSVEDFQVVATKDDEGEVNGRELRFIVRSPTDGVEGFAGQYIRRVGRHAGVLKVSYTKNPTPSDQEPLFTPTPMETATLFEDAENIANVARAEHGPISDDAMLDEFGPQDGPCVSCNARIPYEPTRTKHVTGAACARLAGSTIASASLAGGTHQKGTRGRRRLDIPEQVEPEFEDEPIIN